MKALIIQFINFEHEGSLKQALKQSGYTVDRYFASTDNLVDAVNHNQNIDLLVVLGGPIGVYEEEDYPYLKTIVELIKTRLDQQQAMLGICLGCQLIAHAAGAKVYPGGVKEIGWSRLDIKQDAENPLMLFNDVSVLHWHGDTFDLPKGATLLASSSVYPNQAFLLGDNVLALQFHPEVTEPNLEHWYIGHAHEIAAAETLNVRKLRSDGKRYAQTLEQTAGLFWTNFLQGIK